MTCEGNGSCFSNILEIADGTQVPIAEPEGVESPSNTSSNQTEFLSSLGQGHVLAVLCLSVLAVVCNVAALFLTKFTGGGPSPVMVFVRMFCLSDVLVGCYGTGKMAMILYARQLLINFFLPESLFFTASTAACLALLALNLDRAARIAAPLWYAQRVDKASIITGMVFLWNASFVLGFLPLLGWNQRADDGSLFAFFAYFPWHFLLFVGLLWLLCVSGSALLLLRVRRRCGLTLGPEDQLVTQLREVQRYRKLRTKLTVDLVTWCVCYVPYLVFLAAACEPCPLGGGRAVNRDVHHFVAVFVVRALAGAGVQVYRTVWVQGLALRRRATSPPSSSSSSAGSRGQRLLFFRKRSSSRKENGIAAISYSNPLCDSDGDLAARQTVAASGNTGAARRTLAESGGGAAAAAAASAFVLTVAADVSVGSDDEEDPRGICNPAYRPSIQLDQGICGVTEEITAL